MSARNTHLLDWLFDGYTHCQHGTKDWCEGYLKNAAEVIRAQDDHIASLEAALAEAREALKPFAKAEISIEAKDWERISGWRTADRITFADIRRAARALSGKGDGE